MDNGGVLNGGDDTFTRMFTVVVQPNCSNPATVTNLNDAGAGSLRDAIANVCPGGGVNFQVGVMGTITQTSGPYTINKNMIITGPGATP